MSDSDSKQTPVMTPKTEAHVQALANARAEILADMSTALLRATKVDEIFITFRDHLASVVDIPFYVSAVDLPSQTTSIVALANFGGLINHIATMIGQHPTRFRVPLSSTPKPLMDIFTSGKLVHMPGGVADVVLGAVPRPVSRALEKLIGIDKVYTMGLSWQGQLFGSMTLLLPPRRTLSMPSLIEAMAKQVAQALQRHISERRLGAAIENWQTTFDGVADMVSIVSPSCEIIDLNIAGGEILGCPREQLRGGRCYQAMFNEPAIGPACPCPEAIRTGKAVTTEAQIRGRTCSLSAWPVRSENGDADKLILFVKDISEQKKGELERMRLAEQLRQAQKMEAIGVLAGGIAHDFNNILGAIVGNADLLARSIDPKSNPARHVEHIRTAARRAADLVRQILTFSRRAPARKQPVRLFEPVAEAVGLLRSTLPSTIDLRISLDPDTGTVMADPTQIHQVVMNLCMNAVHAVGETGIIEIRLGSVDINQQQVSAQLNELRPGPHAVFSVSDNGCGMDEQTKLRIFEPFFTTKDVSKGSGLGLAVVHGIVHESSGAIRVETSPGNGTVFTVYLPLNAVETPQEKTLSTETSTPGHQRGDECVLFIDDEPHMVDIARDTLEDLGYTVEGFTSSSMALTAFRESPQKFDLVVTDQTMPGLTGQRVAIAIRLVRPDIPIVLCSGYSGLVTREDMVEAGVSDFLPKPYGTRELSAVVRKAIDGCRNRQGD